MAPIKKAGEAAIPALYFEIKIVNSNGTSDIQSLQYDDPTPIKLNCKFLLEIVLLTGMNSENIRDHPPNTTNILA